MVTYFEASLDQLSVHRVGNKLQDEFYVLSDNTVAIKDALLNKLLMQYFLNPFEKVNEVFHFMHSSGDVSLNELYHFCNTVFDQPAKFHEISQQIAKFLFHTANHAKIKAGEFYMVFFNSIQLEGELMDAIGLFKSETKEPYLKVALENESFYLDYEEAGINIHKLDKGCLIFNTDKEKGYRIVITDQTSRGSEAVYWKDEFLQLKIRNDDFNQTNNALKVYKSFVTSKLDSDFDISKADKIDLLNRSLKYFKEKEHFALEEFAEEVIGNADAIDSFKTFKQAYEKSNETEIGGTFAISASAVKKQERAFKSVLKLDKNFHIYIHGNKELIEKGFDDDKAMNYYKVYFKEEA